MKSFVLCSLVAAVLTMAGCTSLHEATKFNMMAVDNSKCAPPVHMTVTMDGWYFLGFLPLFTGSAAKPGYSAVFRNTVTTENAVRLLTRTAREKYNAARITSLTSQTDSTFLLPFLSSYKRVDVSATCGME